MGIGYVPFVFQDEVDPIPLARLDADLAYISGKTVSLSDFMSAAELLALEAGTTVDVSASIAAAHAALPTYGGTVNWPIGSFKFSTVTLPLYPKNIRWVGAARQATVVEPSAINTPLIQSGGQVSMAGGVRFRMEHMGIRPHASGSTGMAVDCRNMSYSVFHDIAFIQNGIATFAIGFDLYAADSGPSASNCYYNVFDQIYVTPTTPYNNLPVKKLYAISGTSGVHNFTENYVSGVWPDVTSPVVSIATYCRQNTFENCYFEGMNLTNPHAVFEDSGYGTKITHCYFENTGQPYYSAAEIESGTREWCIIEGCAFAANTLEVSTSGVITNGVVFRDNYAYGSDSDVLEFLYTYEKINRAESIAFNVTGEPTVKARTVWENAQNFYLAINDNGLAQAVEAEGAAALALQSTGGGGQAAIGLATAVTAGSALSYVFPVFWQSAAYSTGQSGLGAAQYLLKDTGTSRSLNAAGTLNANGADFAEYKKKSPTCGEIAKGDIVGIDKNGEITDKFKEAKHFLVKSTDPSYVGGDNWASAEKIGERPIRKAAKKAEGQLQARAKKRVEWAETKEEYDARLQVWLDRLEAERQKRDRLAFSGQVPVNIQGSFSEGDYIVPVEAPGGGITGEAVFAVTFDQYRICVGKVDSIYSDGRPYITVKAC